MRKKSKFDLRSGWRQRLLIVGSFFFVVGISLILGLPNIDRPMSLNGTDGTAGLSGDSVPALTMDEYRGQTLQATSPFLSQVAVLKTEDLAGENEALAAEATGVSERLLEMKHVPADAKDVHLRLVLLVDQWRRALSGSIAERRSAVANTSRLLKEQPWLTAGAAPLGPDTTVAP